MTLRKSHDDMARFLAEVCRWSDKQSAPRSPTAQKQYDKAKKLIAQAKAMARHLNKAK